MTITVEPFASGLQKPEFFQDWIEAKNRAQHLANMYYTDYALFDEDHNLETVVSPEKDFKWLCMIYSSLLREVYDECMEAGGQLESSLMDRIIGVIEEARL